MAARPRSDGLTAFGLLGVSPGEARVGRTEVYAGDYFPFWSRGSFGDHGFGDGRGVTVKGGVSGAAVDEAIAGCCGRLFLGFLGREYPIQDKKILFSNVEKKR